SGVDWNGLAQFDRAAHAFERGLPLARRAARISQRVDHRWLVAKIVISDGALAFWIRDFDRTITRVRESQTIIRENEIAFVKERNDHRSNPTPKKWSGSVDGKCQTTGAPCNRSRVEARLCWQTFIVIPRTHSLSFKQAGFTFTADQLLSVWVSCGEPKLNTPKPQGSASLPQVHVRTHSNAPSSPWPNRASVASSANAPDATRAV